MEIRFVDAGNTGALKKSFYRSNKVGGRGMITVFNRELVLAVNEQQAFFEAQQALSHAEIAFQTAVYDNTKRMLQRQDVMGIRAQYPQEYRVYVHKKDADLARHVLKYKNDR